jgi:hypothetical protein
MRPLAAHCHSHLAGLLRHIRAEHAREHQAAAATMYREMAMRT